MPDSRITAVRAREVLDWSGRPTVEADVWLVDGSLGRAAVPACAGDGASQASELRDGGERQGGAGVRLAVANVNSVLAPAVVGLDAMDQEEVDGWLVEVDGTVDGSRLGANSLLAVSLATCRAAAASRGVPAYRHVAALAGVTQPTLPLPLAGVLDPARHARGRLDIRDVLAVPTGARSFAEALDHLAAILAALAVQPRLASNEDALDWLAEAIDRAGVQAGIALDLEARRLATPDGRYRLPSQDRTLEAAELVDLLRDWARRWPVVSIEDGLTATGRTVWRLLSGAVGGRAQLVGRELRATKAGHAERAGHEAAPVALLVEVGGTGTLTNLLALMAQARDADCRTLVAAGPGETEDPFLADLVVGTASGQVKAGSATARWWPALWNRLIRIEEELGPGAYVGDRVLAPAEPGSPSGRGD